MPVMLVVDLPFSSPAGASAVLRVIDYDVPPPPPDEIVYVDARLMFSDPEFDFAPPPPPPLFFLPPPPPDFIVLEPPPPPIGLFISCRSRSLCRSRSTSAAGLCRAAAEQHHFRQHPQHDRHQQRHQSAASAGGWQRSTQRQGCAARQP